MVHPSVRNDVRTYLKQGQTPKLATSQKQAYEISWKHNSKKTDPLKLLIQKQQKDEKTGDGVIQKNLANPIFYDIILFNNCIIKNIANFRCNYIQRF